MTSKFIGGFLELTASILMMAIALLILIFILKIMLLLIPAIIVALVVLLLTGSLTLAGLAFLVTILLGFLKKL